MGIQGDAAELFVYVQDLYNDFPMSRASFMPAEFLVSIFVLFCFFFNSKKKTER